MKKEYNIKDTVWIHIGERKLTQGRVVDVIDLEHLGEGHSRDNELYIIEIKTGIDNIYEVRDFEQISPDEKGPITLFRKKHTEAVEAQRMLKKIGVLLPTGEPNPECYPEEFTGDGHDGMGTTAEEVKPKKRTRRQYRARKKKNDA